MSNALKIATTNMVGPIQKTDNANTGGNPWHDEKGRFTFSPFGSLVYDGHGGYNSRGEYVGSGRHSWGGYTKNTNSQSLTVKFGYDEKYDSTDAEFEADLDKAFQEFKAGAMKEYKARKARKQAEEKAKQDSADKLKKDVEKFNNISEAQIEKAAAKYEKEIRSANPKAEAKIAKGQEIKNLATFATHYKSGDFSDDGARFSGWALNGTEAAGAGKAGREPMGEGRITKSTSQGDMYLSGTTATYGTTPYKIHYDGDSKSASSRTSTYVDDYNGVAMSHVNYTDFYNKMVKGIARNKAIEELLS